MVFCYRCCDRSGFLRHIYVKKQESCVERFLRKKLENKEKELINSGKQATIICIV